MPDKVGNFFGPLNHPFDVTTFIPISPQGRRKRQLHEENQSINETDSGERGYDVEQNEHFEKHAGEMEVENVEIGQSDQDGWDDDKDLLEEEEIYGRKASIFVRNPPNFATSRWTIYKRLAALAERYNSEFY